MPPVRETVPAVAQAEPDQAVTGWRCWFVLPQENLLRPIAMRGMVWRPRQPHEALCPQTLHVPPHEGCKCGIWAVLEPDQLEEIGWTSDPPKGIDKLPGRLVVGQVAMWGRMLQHDRGWRSSHAYPKHLYVFTQDAAVASALRDAYLVPVEHGEKASLLRRLLPGGSGKGQDPDEATEAERRELAKAREEVQRQRQELQQQQQQLARELGDLRVLRRQARWRDEGQALRRQLEAAGIQHEQVAREAGVGRSLISHVLAGRSKSAKVTAAAERLLAGS